MMKKLVLMAAFLWAAVWCAEAQSLSSFKEQLAREVISEATSAPATVVATEQGSAAEVVRDLSNRNTKSLALRGYRVCIFFDNGQDARAGAMEARTLFEEKFPGEALYMVYENPYFRVTVGNCLTIEEAIILKAKVAEFFPKAFPKSEELLLSDLLK